MGKKSRIKAARRAEKEKLIDQLLAIEDEERRLAAEIARLEAFKVAEYKKMLTPQPGQATIRLPDFLTDEQINVCLRILNNAPDHEQAELIEAYLSQFEEQLAAKGLNVDYAAHMVVATGMAARRGQNATNKPVPPSDPHGFFGAN